MASDTMPRASGRWPEILADLAGVTDEQLSHRKSEGPCPNCGGTTRFRWDQDDGDGAWHCSHCGGKNRCGGGGNGADLLMRLQGWTFAQAMAEVDRWLQGKTASGSCQPRRAQPKLKSRDGASAELLAFRWLEAAEQTAEEEGFSPAKARGGAYSSRWLRWSGENPELAASILLEFETSQGIDPPPPEPPKPPPPRTPLETCRAALAVAVARGSSTADLEQLVLALAAEHETSPASLGRLLRALQQEQVSADAAAAGRQALAVAADRQEIGAALVSLESLLPPSCCQAVRLLTQYLPADDIACTVIILAATASVMKLGSEIIAHRSAGFKVPLNLFMCLVGRSGAKKGPLTRKLLDLPIDPIADDLTKQHARNMAQWREQNSGKKPAERAEQPLPIRIRCSEWTGESLDANLAALEAVGLGMLISREEISGMFGSLNAYRGGRGADSEKLLEAYDGRGSASLRISADGGGRFYSRCHVSVAGSVQPDVLKALVADGDASGLWARFLFCPLPSRVVPIPPDESEEQVSAVEAAAALLVDLIGQAYRHPQMSLELSHDARREFLALEARYQAEALRAPTGAASALWGKAAGKVLRLSGLAHVLHRVSNDGQHSDQVEPWLVTAAANLVEHLNGWTLGLHEAATGHDASDLMRLLHRRAEVRGPLSWREFAQGLSSRQRQTIDSAAAKAAAGVLAELGYGELLDLGRGWRYRATGPLPE